MCIKKEIINLEEKNKKIKLDMGKIITVSITTSLTIFLTVVLIGALVIVVMPILKEDTQGSLSASEPYLNRIQYVLNEVSDKYVEDVDMDTLVEGAIKGITAATGDPYTRYISEEEYNEMQTSSVEPYSGIGVHLTFDSEAGGIEVLGIMPNSPATKADIKIGDIIIQVEDIVVTSETYQ